jgi:hypothetical protein
MVDQHKQTAVTLAPFHSQISAFGFAALLAQAGLRLTAVTPIGGSFFSAVEATTS